MIIINNQEYNNYEIKIDWSNFSVYSNGKRRIGIAPFITFNIENNIFIGLEFTFSKEMFKDLELNKKINVEQYISDIVYEDEEGWISIINQEYNCNITRKDEINFKIEFCIENIIINTIIELSL